MGDIINSIKAYLYDKAVSPLFGAFAVSWAVWNYEVILILFSSMEVSDKTYEIESHFDHIFYEPQLLTYLQTGYLFHSLIIPLIGVFFYLYIYPKLAKPIYERHLLGQSELLAIKQKAEGSQLLSLKDSRVLRAKLAQIESKFYEEEAQYREQIKSLTDALNEETSKHKVEVDDLLLKLNQSRAEVEAMHRDAGTGFEFPDLNNSDIDFNEEGLRKYVTEAIKAHPNDNFSLQDLLPVSEWESLKGVYKERLERKFMEAINKGLFDNVINTKNYSGGASMYQSSSEDIDLPKLVLEQFGGVNTGDQITIADVSKNLDSVDENVIGSVVDELLANSFIRPFGSRQGKSQFVLTDEGRRELISKRKA